MTLFSRSFFLALLLMFSTRLLATQAGAAPHTTTATQPDGVDDYISEQMQKDHVPGLSLAVVQGGKILKSKGYGLANVELQAPATADTVFEIGSITKQFTATATMMLAEQGKLSLNDRISQHVKGTPTSWKGVTVRHLLGHTSGIKAYTSVDGFDRATLFPTTHEEVVKLMAAYPVEFESGEKWAYSNTGYYLLGAIIEKASGESYADFLQKHIFSPLEMTSTRVNDEKAIIANRASGYTWRENALQHADAISMTWPYAAGAVVSTVNDLAKWDAALYTERLLKKSSLEAMWTPGQLNNGTTSGYGFGWFVSEIGKQPALMHGGSIPGFESFMYRFPQEQLMVVVLANQDGMTNPTRLAQGVLRHYNPSLAPEIPTPIEDREPQIAAMVKRVFEQAAEGKVDATRFTPEEATVAAVQVERMKGVLQRFGQLKSVSLVGRTEEGQNRLYHYRLDYEKTSLLVLCTINPENKIAGLAIAPE